MRTKFASILLLTAALGIGSAAFSAGTAASGTIKSIDTKAMTVTLADGSVYELPAGFMLTYFKVGEKVTLTWEQKGAMKLIDTMVAA